MDIEQVLETYDARYAAEYDDTFLHDGWTKASVAFQLELIGRLLERATSWLDVACGTGYVLSQFPQVDRAGLDISPDMLAKARQRNPGVPFVQRSYLEPSTAWNDRWDLVTCMWWAYCFCETAAQLDTLIGRLADWTSPGGTCMLPLCNPQKFDRHNTRIPYIDPKVPGRCMITGITWAWIQENGKRHDNMLAPQVDHLIAMFRRRFHEVEIVEGPLELIGEGWRVQDVLVARRKRADRPVGDLYSPADEAPVGCLEWLFSTDRGSLAGLAYPTRALSHVKITVARTDSGGAWTIAAQKIGYCLKGGDRYTVTFAARAAAPRRVHVDASIGAPPWTLLGLSQEVEVGLDWEDYQLTFESAATTDRGRIRFGVGQDRATVEIRDVRVRDASGQNLI